MQLKASPVRLAVSLLAIFIAIVSVSIIGERLAPGLAIGVTVATSTCIILFLMHRWFLKIPVYSQQLRELRAVANLTPALEGLLMPLGIWAMEPAALANVLSHVQSRRCRVVVECGAGISTVFLGKALKQQGFGHLYTIEEDQDWFSFMARLVAEQELGDFVSLIHAPVIPTAELETGTLWYSTTVLDRAINGLERIDLLIVDGPKSVSPLSRYPALPFFAPKVDSQTVIVLDDVERDYEREVLRRWEQEFSLEVDIDIHSKRWQAYMRLKDQGSTGPIMLRAF